MHRPYLLALSLPLFAGIAQAQALEPIERVRITDNDLGCKQIFDERNVMDKAIADAKAAQSSGQNTATAGQAAGVAAEVASRTGLFGSLGGLGGHIFGTVASKTAANVAEQSGQQDATKAAEREKQALARKEHLTQVFLAKGCSAADPSAPPRTPNAAPAVASAAVAAAPVAAPALEASADTLSGKRATPMPVAVEAINPEDLLGSNKTLIVPTAYVTLVTDGRVHASKQSGALQRGNASAHAAANFKSRGLDKAYAQQLAKAAQDNLVAQLRSAGYTVLTYADVKDREVFRGAGREGGQVTASEGGLNTLTVAPTDEQLFKSGFAGGQFLRIHFRRQDTHRRRHAADSPVHVSRPAGLGGRKPRLQLGFRRRQCRARHEHGQRPCQLAGATRIADDARHSRRSNHQAGHQRERTGR
jgi:hypothetical protein